MDEQNRMMHYPQNYGLNMGGEGGQATSPGGQTPEESGGQTDGIRGHADINSILDQIMNITDQSLDEAQVLFSHFVFVDQAMLFSQVFLFDIIYISIPYLLTYLVCACTILRSKGCLTKVLN